MPVKHLSRRPGGRERYRVGTLEKGLAILETLEKEARPLSIKDLHTATGIERTCVFRLLTTLEERGYVTRRADKRYSCLQWHRRVTIAYLAPLEGTPVRECLLESIRSAASRPHIKLVTLGNDVDDAETADRNAALLDSSAADVAVLFQPDASIAHMLVSRFASIGLPHITVCSPVEGVVYLGPNNYQCGKQAGQTLGLHIVSRWGGKAACLAALEPAQMGAESLARVSGMQYGCAAVTGRRIPFRVIHALTRRYREEGRALMRDLLASLPADAKVAVACFNDPTAVGVLDAAREAGCEDRVAVVSHSGTADVHAELGRPGSRLIASIGYFPERWGERIVRLAIAMANGEPVEPAVTMETVVLTRENLARHYPGVRIVS